LLFFFFDPGKGQAFTAPAPCFIPNRFLPLPFFFIWFFIGFLLFFQDQFVIAAKMSQLRLASCAT
jgi:hypothetical protein